MIGGCGLDSGSGGLNKASRLEVRLRMRYWLHIIVGPHLGDIFLLGWDLRPLSFIRWLLESDREIAASVTDNLGARTICI